MSGNEDEFAEIVADLNELEATFEEEAKKDRNARKKSESPTLETGVASANQEREREYQATSHVVVPHEKLSGAAQRPLSRRPDGPPPLRSVSVTTDAPTRTYSGFSQGQPYEYTVPAVTDGDTYSIECTIHNLGGLDATPLTVDLFVEHRQRDVTMDANANTGKVELHPGQVPPTPSGFTTLPPGSTLALVSYVDQGSGLTAKNQLDVDWNVRVDGDRGFASSVFGGKPSTFLGTSTSVPQGTNDYTIRIYDVSDLSLPRNPPDQNLVVSGQIDGTAPLLGEASGTYTTSVDNQIREMDLASTVQSATHVDQQVVSLPQRSDETVAFEYTHSPPSGIESGTTVCYVRAYSLASPDTPNDWGALDHVTMRHVGRTELYWANRLPSTSS